MLPSEPFLRLLFATIAVTWQVTFCQNARCYDATCDVRGELISSGVSARHCCLELSAGRAYDFGGNQEACHTCEVLGWRGENIYVTEGSSVEVSFGIVKGSLSVPYTFQVEVLTNTANISVVSDVNTNNIRVVVPSIALMLQVPHYHDAQSYNRTATLRLIQLAPGRKEGQFLYPDVMTLHVIDPEVQFQRSHYSLRYPHSSLIVCLTYYNTLEGVFVQFDSEVLIRGGTFSQVESFNFTRSSRNSCLNITLPLSELDPLSDTEFSADIQLPMDPVFHLGPVSSATITVEAIEAPQVQFSRPDYSLRFPDSSLSVCLQYPAPDAMYVPFEAQVTLSTKEGTSGRDKFLQSMNYRFTDSRSRSCQNISLPTSELQQFRDTVFLLAIRTEEDSVFGSGDVNTTRITVQGLPPPEVEFDADSYSALVFPEETVPVCLVYNYTDSEDRGQFDVVVNLTKDGRVIHSQTFKFTPNAAESCQNLLIPSRELDLFSDTTFTAHVAVLPESGVRLGEMSTAVIIMVGIDAPQVQFEHGSYTLEPPLTSVPVCIVSTTPEEGAPAFSVSVSVTTDGTLIHRQVYNFAENESISCQNITLSLLTLNQHRNTDIKLEIDTPREPTYQVGRVSSTVVAVKGKPERDPTIDGDPSSLNKKSDNSGTPSWAIALSVVLPVLIILTVTVTVAVAYIYWQKHHGSYIIPPQKLDT